MYFYCMLIDMINVCVFIFMGFLHSVNVYVFIPMVLSIIKNVYA